MKPIEESLREWVTERRDNCLKLAEGKTLEDQQGWLNDAKRFTQILAILNALPAIETAVEELKAVESKLREDVCQYESPFYKIDADEDERKYRAKMLTEVADELRAVLAKLGVTP